MDLYYRLNVFPILLPPLRERREDIVLLAEHFLALFTAKEHKSINGFSDYALKQLINYNWPGNIRELENMIERSVLLTSGQLITSVALPAVSSMINADYSSRVKTMNENERDNIIAALDRCGWKIYGKGGAAELLDINANTLHSRMKKLGIEKQISSKK
jgi:transcriptional regulator with GAF, ATPase, and Fis domain